MILLTALGLQHLYKVGVEPIAPTPAGRDAANYTLPLAVEPRSLVNDLLTEPINAISLYKQAIADYRTNQGLLDNPSVEDVAKGLQLLVEARKAAKPGVFADRPEELINYDPDRLPLKTLKSLADVGLVAAARYAQQNQPEKQKEMYQAIFVLGMKLNQERLVFSEWTTGRDLMAVSHYLTKLAATDAEKQRWQQFEQQWSGLYEQRIKPVQLAISGGLQPHAGDMIAIATHCPEPMWQVEALLSLGRCRFSGQTMGDRTSALRVLERFSTASDPRLRLAATIAAQLTVEDYRKLR